MSSRRTLILLGAILVGIIAAFALFNYVSGIEDRANENAELEEVFKAQDLINKGLTGREAFDQGQIDTGEIPREFMPDGFVSSIDEIEGQVALFDIPAGTVLVKDMFVDPSLAVISFAERLKEDGSRVAISFQVDTVHGVADLLVPGDYVNIFLRTAAPSFSEEPQQYLDNGPANPTCQRTVDQGGCVVLAGARMFYQDVHILAIGQTPILTAGEATEQEGTEQAPIQAGLITVDVPIEAAQWIASVDSANFYLTLNPENYTPQALPPLNPIVELLPGEEGELTPYGPTGDDEE